jgi:hypothetical protein
MLMEGTPQLASPPHLLSYLHSEHEINKAGNVRVKRCCRGKATGIAYSERVFAALVIQHATRMRFIIWSYAAFLGLPYIFPHI